MILVFDGDSCKELQTCWNPRDKEKLTYTEEQEFETETHGIQMEVDFQAVLEGPYGISSLHQYVMQSYSKGMKHHSFK